MYGQGRRPCLKNQLSLHLMMETRVFTSTPFRFLRSTISGSLYFSLQILTKIYEIKSCTIDIKKMFGFSPTSFCYPFKVIEPVKKPKSIYFLLLWECLTCRIYVSTIFDSYIKKIWHIPEAVAKNVIVRVFFPISFIAINLYL